MAKAITPVGDDRPCDKLLRAWCEFLVTQNAKQAKTKVRGKARERAPGETGYPVKLRPQNAEGVI